MALRVSLTANAWAIEARAEDVIKWCLGGRDPLRIGVPVNGPPGLYGTKGQLVWGDANDRAYVCDEQDG